MMLRVLFNCIFLGVMLLSGCARKKPTMHPSKHKGQFPEETIKRYDARDLLQGEK